MTKSEVDRLIDSVGIPEAAQQCHVASALFTYRCSIACRHCLFGCQGDRPDVVMTPEQCVDALRMLHETGRVIHIAGGEAMLYWDTLRESVRLAHEADVAPHFIETNCYWAEDDDIVKERFEYLAEHGVPGMYASGDPFHQEFVPAGRFLRARRMAKEIFGEKNYYGSESSEEDVRGSKALVEDEARLRDYVRGLNLGCVGTAHRELARFLDTYAPDDPNLPEYTWMGQVENGSCLQQFRTDTLWELHIDPYGNIQTNCGIILGNVADTTPAEVLARGPENANPFTRTVAESGALGLARLAQQERGFELPERVTQTCELCYLTRRFLRQFNPDVFGPEEVYA